MKMPYSIAQNAFLPTKWNCYSVLLQKQFAESVKTTGRKLYSSEYMWRQRVDIHVFGFRLLWL
jgi:hypothetical protein